MTRRLIPLLALLGCGRKDDGTVRLMDHTAPPAVSPAEDPPVATNSVSPVRYPPALLEKGIEGRVLLRLYVDSAGVVIPESTRIAESSGAVSRSARACASAPPAAAATPSSCRTPSTYGCKSMVSW